MWSVFIFASIAIGIWSASSKNASVNILILVAPILAIAHFSAATGGAAEYLGRLIACGLAAVAGHVLNRTFRPKQSGQRIPEQDEKISSHAEPSMHVATSEKDGIFDCRPQKIAVSQTHQRKGTRRYQIAFASIIFSIVAAYALTPGDNVFWPGQKVFTSGKTISCANHILPDRAELLAQQSDTGALTTLKDDAWWHCACERITTNQELVVMKASITLAGLPIYGGKSIYARRAGDYGTFYIPRRDLTASANKARLQFLS